MFWVIGELKRKPVLYGLSFFVILVGYLAGGLTALRLEESAGAAAAGYFFRGNVFGAVLLRIVCIRLVLMIIQAFLHTWIVTTPLAAAVGMLLQVSISLPWWCAADRPERGVFIAVLTLPIMVLQMICAAAAAEKGMEHFCVLFREMRQRKSAEELLRGGLITARKMLPWDAGILLISAAEVYLYLNIA